MSRRYASRISRNYLIDFCSTWILDNNVSLESADMEAVIEGRIDEYDQRGFKLGAYYNNATPEMRKRLIRSIKEQVETRLYYRKITKEARENKGASKMKQAPTSPAPVDILAAKNAEIAQLKAENARIIGLVMNAQSDLENGYTHFALTTLDRILKVHQHMEEQPQSAPVPAAVTKKEWDISEYLNRHITNPMEDDNIS